MKLAAFLELSHGTQFLLVIIIDWSPSMSVTSRSLDRGAKSGGQSTLKRIVIVPHNCHYNQNGWLKYDHRVMYKINTTPLPSYGTWGSRKTC